MLNFPRCIYPKFNDWRPEWHCRSITEPLATPAPRENLLWNDVMDVHPKSCLVEGFPCFFQPKYRSVRIVCIRLQWICARNGSFIACNEFTLKCGKHPIVSVPCCAVVVVVVFTYVVWDGHVACANRQSFSGSWIDVAVESSLWGIPAVCFTGCGSGYKWLRFVDSNPTGFPTLVHPSHVGLPHIGCYGLPCHLAFEILKSCLACLPRPAREATG